MLIMPGMLLLYHAISMLLLVTLSGCYVKCYVKCYTTLLHACCFTLTIYCMHANVCTLAQFQRRGNTA
jgi:hypothetical protein